jgi:hypothetical protein
VVRRVRERQRRGHGPPSRPPTSLPRAWLARADAMRCRRARPGAGATGWRGRSPRR